MKTEYFGIFRNPDRPYRNCEADDIRRHPASVVSVTIAQHRDSLIGIPVYTGRVDFADGTRADFRFASESARDAFAAEFQARIKAAA